MIVRCPRSAQCPRRNISSIKKLIPEIKKAFQHLSEQYDIIVIEAPAARRRSAKSDDIVNMGMARMAGAPVLLAGDIDRGGVFAQLYGTVALLEPDEQAMVKGLIINKFRGDKTILDPGVEMIEKLCRFRWSASFRTWMWISRTRIV